MNNRETECPTAAVIANGTFPSRRAQSLHQARFLRNKAAFNRCHSRIHKGKTVGICTFYSMMGVGEYTMSAVNVVWKGIERKFIVAAIVLTDCTMVTEHNEMTVSAGSDEEAYYFAGMLGNVVTQFIAVSCTPTLSTTTRILEVLNIPEFNNNYQNHPKMS